MASFPPAPGSAVAKSAAAEFSDLLQQAEQLAAEIDPSGLSSDLPRVERNLGQLAEAGARLFSKTSRRDPGGQEAKAAILLGSRGVDLPALQQRLQSLAAPLPPEAAAQAAAAAPTRDADIAGFLRREREHALLSVIEETRRETFEQAEKQHWDAAAAEWETEKRRILTSLGGGGAAAGGAAADDLSRSLRPEVSRLHESTLSVAGVRSSLDHLEVAYATVVTAHNTTLSSGGHGSGAKLAEKFAALFPQEKDQEACALWEMVGAFLDLPKTSLGDVAKWRAEAATMIAIVNRARTYLEKSNKRFLQSTVFSNRRDAKLGGIPGTIHLVRSYVNLKVPASTPGLEDGLVEGVPVWALVYHCLRCGDIEAAVTAASNAGQGLAEVQRLLSEMSSGGTGRLSPQSEAHVRLAYRRSIRAATDPFKRAVYCVLAACDPSDEHAEVASSLDDYLWLKLSQIREDAHANNSISLDTSSSLASVHVDTLILPQLQTLLSEEYGEAHFNAFEQPVLYFQVLLLTGQFESAVAFLFRVERFRAHAVHIALGLNEAGVILTPGNVHAAILSKDPSDKPPTKRLNLARLLMLYVRKFEGSDPVEALQYLYFLRNVKTAPAGGGEDSLFTACVAELVLESREFELLLGSIAADGTRTPGLVDKLLNGGEAAEAVVASVARECERRGMLADAAALFDLAHDHEKAASIVNKLLAQAAARPTAAAGGGGRERLRGLAISLAKRYRTLGSKASRETTASLYLLLDLMTFFDLFHASKHEEALDTVSKIKLIPLCQSDVDPMVANFRLLQDEVRRNLPDLLIATMTILFAQFKRAKGGQGQEVHLQSLREKARAVLTFTGIIPYRMPGDTNARLVQMEVLMN